MPGTADPSFIGAFLAGPSSKDLSGPFAHAKHVPDEWWLGAASGTESGRAEFAQDCRGCHVFALEGRVESAHFLDPKQCYLCHIEGTFEVTVTDELREPIDETSSLFRHHEHLNLECATCHRPPRAAEGEVPEVVVPTAETVDGSYCMSCHATEFEWSALVKRANKEGTPSTIPTPSKRSSSEMKGRLNDGIQRRGNDGVLGEFSHAAHMGEVSIADSTRCADCHGSLFEGGADPLRVQRFSLDSCAECHTGVRFEGTWEQRVESAASGTFLHSQHTETSCSACHAVDPSGATFITTLDLSPNGYEACTQCHEQHPGGRAPARIEGHGTGFGARCVDCHMPLQPGTVLDGAFGADRAMLEVHQAANRYGLGAFAHAGMDKGASASAESCSECHRVPIETREPRPTVAFNHGDHLDLTSGQFDSETCARCHADPSGEDLQLLDGLRWVEAAHLGQGSCSDCHGEGSLATAEGESTTRQRSPFAHGQHVGKNHGGSAMDCATCHEADVAAGGFPATDAARNCATCHNHGPSNALVQANRVPALEKLQACVRCHSVGIPGEGAPVVAQRWSLVAGATQAGFEHNPNGEDCVKCHKGPNGALLGGTAAAPFQAPDQVASFDELEALNYRRARPAALAGRYLGQKVSGDDGLSPHSPVYTEQRLAAGRDIWPDREVSEVRSRYFLGWIPEATQEESLACLHCHWNSIELAEKLRSYDIYPLGAAARTRFGRGLSKGWSIGLAGVANRSSLLNNLGR